jgi:hypothetical protein
MSKFSKEQLEMAKFQLTSARQKIEKFVDKFKVGTAQHTLAIRRIDAFALAISLIEKECINVCQC